MKRLYFLIIFALPLYLGATPTYQLNNNGVDEDLILWAQEVMDNAIKNMPEGNYLFSLSQDNDAVMVTYEVAGQNIKSDFIVNNAWEQLDTQLEQLLQQITNELTSSSSIASSQHSSIVEETYKEEIAVEEEEEISPINENTIAIQTNQSQTIVKETTQKKNNVVVHVEKEDVVPYPITTQDMFVYNNKRTQKKLGVKEYSYGTTQLDRQAMEKFLFNNNQQAYQQFMSSQTFMKAGWWTLYCGVGAMALGIVTVPFWSTYEIGATFLTLGCASAAASVPLLIIGNNKRNNALNLINQSNRNNNALSLSFQLQGSSNGIGLALNF